MLCKHCGYELPETAKFCRSCGKPQLAEVLKISSESPVVNADSTVMVKAPAKAEAESVKVLKSRAKASVETDAESVKAPKSRAKAAVDAEAAPVKVSRPRAKAAADAEAGSVKAEKENAKVPVLENSSATMELMMRPQNEGSALAFKSRNFTYGLIATGLIAFICFAGYWGWTQRATPEQDKNSNSTANVEEKRLRKESEDKSRPNLEKEKDQKKAQAEQVSKEVKERESKAFEKNVHMQWTGRYQCSEPLFPGARIRKEFTVDIGFTTISGKGIFLLKNNQIAEKFFVSIDGTRVEINSEGSRNEDPTKKWFVKTTGTIDGKNIKTSGSMFGPDGRQIIRQVCKFQLNQ